MTKLNGRCLCGSVTYEVSGAPIVSALCHCPSCRRSSGAPAVAWALFPRGAMAFTGDAPARYASSPGATRLFCGRCGSSLAFEADYIDGMIDIAVATLDDSEAIPPQMHIWTRHRLGWFETAGALPAHDEFPPAD